MNALIACLLFLLILCAPGMLICACSDRRAETLLPLSACGCIVMLYLMGLAGLLRFGAAAMLLLAAGCYLGAAACVMRKRVALRTLRSRVCTPAMALFVLLFCMAVVCNYGRMPYHGDEFSHWAYAVKAMTHLNDFAASPAAGALYGSYPPGVQLLQYVVQKLYGLFAGAGAYCDWLLFVPYQMLAFALPVPFLSRYTWRQAHIMLAGGISVFALPMTAFPLIYESTFVDPIIALLAAYCLATAWRARRYDAVTAAALLLALVVLTLSKDTGFALACICALALMASV